MQTGRAGGASLKVQPVSKFYTPHRVEGLKASLVVSHNQTSPGDASGLRPSSVLSQRDTDIEGFQARVACYSQCSRDRLIRPLPAFHDDSSARRRAASRTESPPSEVGAGTQVLLLSSFAAACYCSFLPFHCDY